jgi:aspartokinase/homoserine dehydrogenase 1
MSKVIVMKFGGTSVGSAERITNVANIVAAAHRRNKIVVVVSAMSKVTDLLVSAAKNAEQNHRADLDQDLERLESLHIVAAKELELSKTANAAFNKIITHRIAELRNLLDSIYALEELTPRAFDLVLSFGERLSIHLISQALIHAGVQAKPVEATHLIVTTDQFGDARPLLEASETKAKRAINPLLDQNVVPVVTGFIGATTKGVTATLGRGGSDYSATILGHCLDAREVIIWTDVDGAMTADPRIIPSAQTLPTLSYEEAAELSYFGAKVLHPLTIVPASLKNIPVWVKNTFNPAAPGTKIARHANHITAPGRAVSTMNHVSLITVQGKGMSGVPGVAAKVFGAIAAEDINVLFISQASSEYNISLVVKGEDGKRTAQILRDAFATDLSRRNIETVKVEEHLTIVAVVGEGMRGHPGAAGMIFSSLGEAGVNVVAIAQGSSELNISFIVRHADAQRAVQQVHDVFNLTRAEA